MSAIYNTAFSEHWAINFKIFWRLFVLTEASTDEGDRSQFHILVRFVSVKTNSSDETFLGMVKLMVSKKAADLHIMQLLLYKCLSKTFIRLLVSMEQMQSVESLVVCRD